MLIVKPAYGKDFTSAKEAKAYWRNGADFQTLSLIHGGTYCSIRDYPKDKVEIRYNKMAGMTIYVPEKDGE